MGRGLIARGLGVAAGLMALAAAPAMAQAPGEIGGPPSVDVPLNAGEAARGEPVVMGVGPSAAGRVEIVGQDSTAGLCITVILVDRRQGGGVCSSFAPTPPKLINHFMLMYRPGRPILGQVFGAASPEVASLVTILEKNHRRKYVSPVVARPDASIMARLNLEEPLVYFAATFPGCVPPHKTLTLGFDSNGNVLERHRTGNSPRRVGPNLCRGMWRARKRPSDEN